MGGTPPRDPLPWPGLATSVEEAPLPGLRLRFSLNRDQTEAYLAIPEFPDGLDPATALGLVRQSILVKFPHRANLAFLGEDLPALIAGRQRFHGRVVARGSPPQDGEDGRPEFLVRRPSREFLIKPDGSIDFKTRDLFRSVGAGETILIVHPPTPGTPGENVFGESIPARPGRPTQLALGRNVEAETDPEGRTVVRASGAGQVQFEVRPLSVRVKITPVLTIPGNVDFQTGNINFKGSAVVRGSILTGFSVTVTGNLTVYGGIEPGARVTAGGDLVVSKGILGHPGQGEENPEVKAFGNIRALFAENARVTAEGDLFLRAAMNASLSANGSIRIDKALVGGQTIALQAVQAGEIGNIAGTRTEVSCGVSHSVRTRLNLVIKILDDLKGQLAETEKNLAYVRDRGERLAADQRESLAASLGAKAESLRDQILRLELKKADLAISLLEENQATITAGRFFPGTVVMIRSSLYRVETETVAATFYQKMPEEVIEFRPYRA